LVGLAHITGSGIAGNLDRILPSGVDAEIDAGAIRVLDVFKVIREEAGAGDAEMLRTFNMGVGLCAVVRPDAAETVRGHLEKHGCEAYEIGKITSGGQQVRYRGSVRW
jgi:phosphoribosylformylglycinamidine cyclo-ligase